MLCECGLKMPIRTPFGEFFGVEMEEAETLFYFFSSRNAVIHDSFLVNQKVYNLLCVLAARKSAQKLLHSRAYRISPICQKAP